MPWQKGRFPSLLSIFHAAGSHKQVHTQLFLVFKNKRSFFRRIYLLRALVLAFLVCQGLASEQQLVRSLFLGRQESLNLLEAVDLVMLACSINAVDPSSSVRACASHPPVLAVCRHSSIDLTPPNPEQEVPAWLVVPVQFLPDLDLHGHRTGATLLPIPVPGTSHAVMVQGSRNGCVDSHDEATVLGAMASLDLPHGLGRDGDPPLPDQDALQDTDRVLVLGGRRDVLTGHPEHIFCWQVAHILYLLSSLVVIRSLSREKNSNELHCR